MSSYIVSGKNMVGLFTFFTNVAYKLLFLRKRSIYF